MNSMSFNSIQGQQQIQQTNQPLTLREGQVFHGTIKKLFPDQMAEVQVGNHKLMAKLETPLKAGDAHYFQVTNATGQAAIKVVTGPSASPAQQIQQLMASLNLPKTNDMQTVLSSFIRNETPIVRENLIAAEAFMKALPEGVTVKSALAAIQTMSAQKLPFTQQVFQALVMGSKVDGMTANLQQFMQQLEGANIPQATKAPLMQQLQTITQPLQATVGGDVLAKAVQMLQNPSTSVATKQEMLAVLKEAGVVQAKATLANWQPAPATLSSNSNSAAAIVQQIATMKPEQVPASLQQLSSFIQQEGLLTEGQKTQLQQLVQRFQQLPATPQSIEVFAKQLQQQFTAMYSQTAQATPFATNAHQMTAKEQLVALVQVASNETPSEPVLREIVRAAQTFPTMQPQVQQAEANVAQAIDSKAMEQAVKTVLQSLGLNYEIQLANKDNDVATLAQSLKPQLLALIQDVQISPALKESADLLLARMNGMSIVSGENGPQHQLVMQVPLQFLGKQMDATLQWNGRMKDDGKIDADYARILFYLSMESMQETVIDMQVQNRIVTVTIFNEHTNLSALAEPLQETLRNGLSEKGYHLSGVFMKQFQKTEVKLEKQQRPDQGQGVDIRI